MDSLINKIIEVKKTHPKVDSLLQDLESLREDLVNKFDRGRPMHKQVKVWMKQNRRLVYDIEDWIDLELGNTQGVDESEEDFKAQIEEFKVKIHAARARSERYDLLDKAPTSDANLQDAHGKKVAVDYRLPCWEKKGVIVGIDGQAEKLVGHLTGMETQRKVVSVLGIGGLGKTTLATKVYEQLSASGHFDCYASVTVGGNSSVTALTDLLRQVNQEMVTVSHQSRASLDEQEIIRQLWEFLKTKRYFVFIDDIRNIDAWNVINCALPNNDCKSRILTTSRVKNVAMSCCVRPADVIYPMEGLDQDQSKSLLHSMISIKTDDPPDNFRKYCDFILNKCCGLPLAIIVTAGLLDTKLADLEPLGKPEESDGIGNVLDICFADLARPVKACFLYLSAFPESYTIKKDRLIWRWVGEGFIPERNQESLLEIGESYFNELTRRKLIRPVFDDDNDDQAVACTVHPVIHDFIASLSRQEDFHTTAAELISGPFPYGTIRRFSVDCSRQENNEADTLSSCAVRLSRMRSLTVFGGARRMPDLSAFRYLRVLDLEDTETLDDQQLEKIGLLRLLTYLGLGGTNVTKLPPQLKELKYLSSLDVRRTRLMELPEGLVTNSRRLRMLGVTFGHIYNQSKTNQKGVTDFLKEVSQSNLECFFLYDYPRHSVGLLAECWADIGSHSLRKFELRMSGYLHVVPETSSTPNVDIKISILPESSFYLPLPESEKVEREVAGPTVSISKGVMNSVLTKLVTLMGEPYTELIGAVDEHVILKDELEAMNKFLEELEDMDKLSQEMKDCREQIREMTYDIEDSIDDIEFHFHCDQCISQAKNRYPENWAILREFIDQIRSLTGKIKNTGLGTIAHTAKMCTSRSTYYYVASEPRLSMGFYKAMRPVGLDGPRDQLVRLLLSDDEPKSQVVCISGSAGIGKTTLAKEVYNMIQWRFDRTVFITVSKYTHDDVQRLLQENKRQLVVMDGVLSAMSNDIGDLLAKAYHGCRILITTRFDDVAQSCGKHSSSFIYRMEPLTFADSLSLFQSIILVSRRNCPFSPKLVRACGGVPLAISVIAGVLAAKPSEMAEWNMVEKHIELAGPDPQSVDGMNKIIDISYSALSQDMKTCLTYLCALSHNKVIMKDRLIRRWITEGFLPKVNGETLLQTGKRYFLGLIARKLIEPVYWDDLIELEDSGFLAREKYSSLYDARLYDDRDFLEKEQYDEMPLGCKLSDVVHDFIRSVCREENLVTLDIEKATFIHHKKREKAASIQNDNIRRISIGDRDYYSKPISVADKSKVRSITFLSRYFVNIYDLSAFKHLRVLDLEGGLFFGDSSLKSIASLSLLRYLGLARTRITELPSSILALEHLEILDSRNTSAKVELKLASVPQLVSLLADNVLLLPMLLPKPDHVGKSKELQTGEMSQLEELSMVILNNGQSLHELALLVSKSKRLRVLGVSLQDCYYYHSKVAPKLKMLLDEIEKSSLQSLCITSDLKDVLELLVNCWAHTKPGHLTKFKLTLDDTISELPRKMAGLICLTHLSLTVYKEDAESLHILGSLPKLVSLKLKSTCDSLERRSISKDCFQCLKVFSHVTSSRGGMGLQFNAEAMPQLRTLQLYFKAATTKDLYGNFDFGIEHLSSLARVRAEIDGSDAYASDVKSAEAAIRDQASHVAAAVHIRITGRGTLYCTG